MPLKRGTLIALEGLDRSGKSTQCALLVSHLREQGHTVEPMRFPNRSTPIGQMINSYLTGTTQTEDHIIHLLFAANRWEFAGEIERLIAAGTTVVMDRYYYSGCVYSAAKGVPGMDLAWCRQPEVGLPRPDVWVFLDVGEEAAERRGGYGAERYETRAMQRKVRGLFGEMMGHAQEREDVRVVDAGREVEAVARQVLKAVGQPMEAVQAANHALRKVAP
ncbi:Thymidylate kinase, partial [Teratosphaeriaceae sp. CCFEE 6253]